MSDELKAKIVSVGIVTYGAPVGWCFDCANGAPVYKVTDDGEMLHGGYTLQELEQISKEHFRPDKGNVFLKG